MDIELVLRARQGDEVAFAAIVDRVGGRLEAAARRVLGDRALAQDATQQALVSMWRDLPSLKDAERFDAWAYRTLIRACYREARRAPRTIPMPAGLQPRAIDAIGGVEDRDELERAFRRLTLDQRTVVVLHYSLDLSRQEIATVLGIPLGTVHSRLRLAVAALRAALDADARDPMPHPTPEVIR